MKNNISYGWVKKMLIILLVAAVYFASARMSLFLAFQNTNATPVWPPAGIAFVSLLLFSGYRMWPAVMIGAFCVNFYVFRENAVADLSTNLWVSLAISIGNTLEALIGYYLIEKYRLTEDPFNTVKSVFQFAFITLLMCVVSSTIGPLSICIAQIAPWSLLPTIWFTWWLGDISGIIAFTPLLFAWWNKKSFEWKGLKTIELLVLFALIFVVSAGIFGGWLSSYFFFSNPYLLIPLWLWAALRFQQKEMITAMTISSVIAILGTTNGSGPFISPTLNDSLLSLQSFISIVTITLLALSASIKERKKSKIELQKAHDELELRVKERTSELFESNMNLIREIDEHKKTERALNKQRTLYENLLKAQSELGEGTIITEGSKIIYANEAIEKIYGYTYDELFALESFITLVIPEDRERMVNLLKERLAGRATHNYGETTITHKDGHRVDIGYSIKKIETGEQTQLISIVRDITASKQAEKNLRSSEEKFHKAFEASSAAITIARVSDGEFIDVNESFLNIMEFSLNEVIGHTADELGIIDETEKQPILNRIAKENSVKNFEIKIHTKSGKVRDTLFSADLIDIEGQSCIITVLYDITERKLAENKFKMLMESAPDAMVIVNQHGEIQLVNEQTEKLFGYKRDELLGEKIDVLIPEKFYNQDPNHYFADTHPHILGVDLDVFGKRKDNFAFPVEISLSPLETSEGLMVSVDIRDISERKKVEQDLKRESAYVRLLQEIASAANDSKTIEEAAQIALDKICEHTHWPVGHLYVADEANPRRLLTTKIWHLDDPDHFKSFKNITEQTHMDLGIGLPGRILESWTPAWIPDVTKDTNFPRNKVLEDIGVKAGFGFPIMLGDNVLGVLEFFSIEVIEEPDEQLLEVTANIGTMLGRVAERESAEKEIKKNKDSLSQAQHIGHIGSWEWDFNSDVITWSDELYEIFDVRKEDFKPNFGFYINLIHPEDREYTQKIIEDAFKNKTSFDFVHKTDDKGSKIKFIHSKGEIVTNSEGKPIKMRGTGQDVTESKLMEQSLKEEKSFLQVLQSVAEGANKTSSFNEAVEICIKEVCEVMDWCIGHLSMIKYQDHTINIESTDLWHVHDEVFRNALPKVDLNTLGFKDLGLPALVLSKKSPVWIDTVDANITFKGEHNEEVKVLSALSFPIFHKGRIIAAIEFFSRKQKPFNEQFFKVFPQLSFHLSIVKEREDAEQTLKESEDKFRTLTETAFDAIITADSNSTITYANKSTEEIFGYEKGELTGKSLTSLMPESFRERHLAGIKRYLETGEGRIIGSPVELVGLSKRGIEFPVELTIATFKKGEKHFFTGVLRDISLRKETEKELGTKVQQLAKANEALNKIASHDIQEPLRTISNYVQLLEKRYGSKLDKTANEFIRYAVQGASRLQDLINDLIIYSQIDAEVHPLENIDCNIVLKEVTIKLIAEVKESKATITYENLPIIKGYRSLIFTLFENLVSNSIKFKGDLAPEIIITAKEEKDNWLFEISDNGLGIHEDYAERIFEIFQRLNNIEKYKGTGIGLAICKKIVEKHSGHIWVTRGKDRIGSIFHLTVAKN